MAAPAQEDSTLNPARRGGRSETPWARLAASRWLIVAWAQRDFLVRYRQSGLGFLWAVVYPLAMLGIYGLIFVRVLKIEPEHGSFIVFATCGLVPWTFVSSALTQGIPAFITHQNIVGRTYFPREAIPIAGAVAASVDLLIGTALLCVIVVADGGAIPLSVIALVPIYAGLFLVVVAITTLGATLTVFARDLRHVLPLILQVAFIATPVVYSRELVPDSWRWLFDLNPLTAAIEAVRTVMIDGRWPSLLPVLALLVGGLLATLLACRYIAAVEDRFVDVL
jgi:homopolymeric O-antigen transport system permease protein